MPAMRKVTKQEAITWQQEEKQGHKMTAKEFAMCKLMNVARYNAQIDNSK